MKYIKLYESFNTDIEDILLEITDIGYTTSYGISGDYTSLLIRKPKPSSCIRYPGLNPIEFNEIKDCVLRLKNYMGDRYVQCRIFNKETHRWLLLDLAEDCNTKLKDLVNHESFIALIIYYNI